MQLQAISIATRIDSVVPSMFDDRKFDNEITSDTRVAEFLDNLDAFVQGSKARDAFHHPAKSRARGDNNDRGVIRVARV